LRTKPVLAIEVKFAAQCLSSFSEKNLFPGGPFNGSHDVAIKLH